MPYSRSQGESPPRRLTSKTLAFAVPGHAAKLLQPLQFSVGVRGRCEVVVHATRTALEREDEPKHRKWKLQVDLENGCFGGVLSTRLIGPRLLCP